MIPAQRMALWRFPSTKRKRRRAKEKQVDLARFYMARGMYPEAVGVLNLALADSKPGAEDPAALIVHAVANILMGVVDYHLDIQQAVNAPRFHHQWLPDQIYLEGVGFSPDTVKMLESRGHKIRMQGYWSDGECIAIDPRSGDLLGAPDGRGGGKAVGF